jgi:hypothetical protein
MGFFTDHWLAIVVVVNTALLVFIAAEGRGVPDRLAYLGRRLDRLDRALRGGRLMPATERPADVKLISDRSAVAAEAESPSTPRRLRAANQ